ncbi:hypothetical protein [Pseudomonas syringae]|uniref:hypothetical protein n=1 Tax=Pseudomonas syringae TaxID=317 RepID=UPI0011D03781|nr:hypothetical protein [Pseudomonas syringae]
MAQSESKKEIQKLSEEELQIWDFYAASALSGYMSKSNTNSTEGPKNAADAADQLLTHRRLRKS